MLRLPLTYRCSPASVLAGERGRRPEAKLRFDDGLTSSRLVGRAWAVGMDAVEADRAGRLPREGLPERQLWRDRRPMALLAHKRRAAEETAD